jgi:hypothetical protein
LTDEFLQETGLASAMSWAKEKGVQIEIFSSTSGPEIGTRIEIVMPFLIPKENTEFLDANERNGSQVKKSLFEPQR